MRYSIEATGLNGIIDLGLQLFRNNLRAVLTIGLLLSLPDLLATGLGVAFPALPADAPALPSVLDGEGLSGLPSLDPLTMVVAALGLLQAFLLFPVTSGALALLYTADIFGEPMPWQQAVQRAWGHKGALCTAMAISTLAIIFGTLLLVLGIYFALRFTLMYHAAILENLDGKQALRRSGQLMRTHYWTALALVFLVWGLTIGVVLGVSATASPLVAGLVQWVAQAAALGVITACYTALYFSARCKHEQFDQTMAAARRS